MISVNISNTYVPIKNKRRETIGRAFTDEWTLPFGRPKYILTDNGGEFINLIF